MLLALSDAAVTGIAAGAAAVFGALVGAAAGGVVDAILERRRESARAKAGARLVAVDLSTAASLLKGIERDAIWYPFQQLEMAAWPEYRDVLAIRLSNDHFQAVAQAVKGVAYLMDGVADMHKRRLGQPSQLSRGAVKRIHIARIDMTDAYNALAELGGLDLVKGVLPDEEGDSP
jgi:hypothetical protein